MRTHLGLGLAACLVAAPLASCGGATLAGTGSEGDDGGPGSANSSSSGSSSSSGAGGSGSSSSGFQASSGSGSGGLPAFDASAGDDGSGLVEDDASPPVDGGPLCAGPQWNGTCVELIDDLETDTGFLPPIGGRDGAWYTYNDDTPGGVQTPVPWPAGTFLAAATTPAFPNPVTGAMSAFSAVTSGSGFTDWGAGMGFQFVLSNSQGVARPYDASAYQGIVFWAHVGASTDANTIRVVLTDGNTENDGGLCGTASECDPFGQTVTLGSAWAPYTLLFADLRQESWGSQYPALDAHALYAMNFEVSPSETFGFDVDDIYFLLK